MNLSVNRPLAFCLLFTLFTAMTGSLGTMAPSQGNMNVYLPLVEAANIICAPLPTLDYPADGETITTLAPDLQFSYTSNPDRIGHRIQISTSPVFDTLVYESESEGTSGQGDFTERLNENLAPDTQHYWRVTFFCNNNTSGSTTATFTTPNIAVPAAPMLSSPQDGATPPYEGTVYFGYSEVPNASYYRIFFEDAINQRTCIVLSEDNSDYEIPSENPCLVPNTAYQWSVRAWTINGWSDISDSRQITFLR